MNWETATKKSYRSDFIKLNKDQQRAVVQAIGVLENDPVSPLGNTIKKLSGWEDVWRYRLRGLRLIYQVAPESKLIRLLAVGPRSSIYQRFNYEGWDAPDAAMKFGPQMTAAPEWTKHQEWFIQKKEPQRQRLPRKLTPSLLKKWQIDERYHSVLMRCLYDEELMNVVESGVPSDVLEQVIERLYPATAENIASQADEVLFRPADLLAFAEGTLTAFLLRLDENQQPLTLWSLAGPTLVKGGPGSGKSTIALYRLREIVKHFRWKTGRLPRILFTTYTNALINFSSALLCQLLRDVLDISSEDELPDEIQISTMYQVYREIAEYDGRPVIVPSKSAQRKALNKARHKLLSNPTGAVKRVRVQKSLENLRNEYLLEEFDWVIEGQDCRTVNDYLDAERVGRGIPFYRSLRRAVWQLFQYYRENLQQTHRYTYGHLVQVALDNVRSGIYKERWDYVIVDEAQDLAPAAIALCLELCHKPAGLFLTADANQSLYNRGFRWTYVHKDLNVTGRTRILTNNYRSTKEIAAAAAQIIQFEKQGDREALAQDYIHSGPYPVIYSTADLKDQARWIARQIYNAAIELRLPPNSAAVLVSRASLGVSLASALSYEGVPTSFMRSRDFDLEDPCVKVTTLHAAKGLEFPIVVVAHVERGLVPWDTEATDQDEIAEFLAAQRRLFYVGCTRAMRYLFITHNRDNPSPFLSSLTDDYWMRL